ncbi:MAG TPA: putative toxin-antitoxin system toxin component, PIN family [Thermodesulfobacteriota bacterium]|jgi:putative PIN family toxin of toxin-antitoxin system|nr:putative toxin-antitoxin system toxin component, PIN family [Thermodesulfobacteriota bacterium]
MKVFLDTNVLVSAVATRGLCTDVLREVLRHHHLIISPELLTELENVFRKALVLPQNIIFEFIEVIKQDSQVSTPSPLLKVSIRDKDDLLILSSALNGGADLFITGDKELLGLQSIRNMSIVSPRVFWERLKA